jgi:hypothetical protein
MVGAWLGLIFLVPCTARAHFLWLTVEGNKPTVHAFLSETPSPEGPEFLKYIEKAKITAGRRVLTWIKADDTFRISLPEPGIDTFDGFCDLGIKSRGGVSFKLIYTARVQFGPSAAAIAEEPDHLRMRLVTRPGKAPVVVVRFRGQPAGGAVVKAFPADGDSVELKSDAAGRIEHALVGTEGAAFLGKWSEKSPIPLPDRRHGGSQSAGPAQRSPIGCRIRAVRFADKGMDHDAATSIPSVDA